jgi:hypothetical protein
MKNNLFLFLSTLIFKNFPLKSFFFNLKKQAVCLKNYSKTGCLNRLKQSQTAV